MPMLTPGRLNGCKLANKKSGANERFHCHLVCCLSKGFTDFTTESEIDKVESERTGFTAAQLELLAVSFGSMSPRFSLSFTMSAFISSCVFFEIVDFSIAASFFLIDRKS